MWLFERCVELQWVLRVHCHKASKYSSVSLKWWILELWMIFVQSLKKQFLVIFFQSKSSIKKNPQEILSDKTLWIIKALIFALKKQLNSYCYVFKKWLKSIQRTTPCFSLVCYLYLHKSEERWSWLDKVKRCLNSEKWTLSVQSCGEDVFL